MSLFLGDKSGCTTLAAQIYWKVGHHCSLVSARQRAVRPLDGGDGNPFGEPDRVEASLTCGPAGIHTWNDATHAPSPGIGILLTNSQSVRCLAVYLDFTALRIEGPTHISVVDSFFLGGGTVVLAPRTDGQPAAAQIEGLVLTDNTFENYKSGPNVTVVVDERNLSFSRPVDMVMKGNIGTTTMVPRSVTATKTLQLSGHLATFNFSDTFVFPKLGIVDASLSVISPSGFVQFALRPPVGQSITVEASEATTASVSVTATQGAFTVGNGRFG